MNRFKEFRRQPRERSKPGTLKTTPVKTQPARKPSIAALMEAPPIPTGEDRVSFERHNKVLLSESKKARPNMQIVCSLMQRTYAFRRGEIISTAAHVIQHLNRYPFLRNADQVSGLHIYIHTVHIACIAYSLLGSVILNV